MLPGSFIVMAMDHIPTPFISLLFLQKSIWVQMRVTLSVEEWQIHIIIYISVHIKLQIKELGYCIDFKKRL